MDASTMDDRRWTTQGFLVTGGAGRIGSVSCDCAFFCTSTSLTSSDGDDADTGTPPLSAPQTPLNTSIVIVGRDDLSKCRQRRADQIDAAHELGRAAVGEHAVDDVGQHVERVRRTAAGRREPAFDVVEQQAERLSLAPRLVAQLRPSAARATRLARLDVQVRLARHRQEAGLRSAVPVGPWESLQAARDRAGTFSAALVDDGDALRLDALVVVAGSAPSARRCRFS